MPGPRGICRWPLGRAYQLCLKPAEMLLFEGPSAVHDLANLRDAPSGKRIKGSDVELHGALAAPLDQKGANMDRDLVALRENDRDMIPHARVAAVDRCPHLPDFIFPAATTQMRQDVDRRVGEKIDVGAAIRHRALDVA